MVNQRILGRGINIRNECGNHIEGREMIELLIGLLIYLFNICINMLFGFATFLRQNKFNDDYWASISWHTFVLPFFVYPFFIEFKHYKTGERRR